MVVNAIWKMWTMWTQGTNVSKKLQKKLLIIHMVRIINRQSLSIVNDYNIELIILLTYQLEQNQPSLLDWVISFNWVAVIWSRKSAILNYATEICLLLQEKEKEKNDIYSHLINWIEFNLSCHFHILSSLLQSVFFYNHATEKPFKNSPSTHTKPWIATPSHN